MEDEHIEMHNLEHVLFQKLGLHWLATLDASASGIYPCHKCWLLIGIGC